MRAEQGCPRRLQFAGLVAGAIVLSAVALKADAADLLEIYHLAQANDPTFAVAFHGYAAAQEKSPQALAGNLPMVNLTGNRNFTDAQASFNGSTPARQGVYAWTWAVQLTQPIMRPQNILAYYESEAQVEAAGAEFTQAEQDMILRVAQAYFDALVAQETVASAEVQLQAMQEQGVVAKRGYELGTASITDSDEARSKAEQARAQLIAAKNDLETKLTEIEKLTGKPVEMLAGLKPAVVIPKPDPFDVSPWVEQAKDNNPSVRAQFSALRAAGFTVTKAKAENFWTLDFVGSYGANYSSGNLSIPTPYETRIKSSVAGIQFTVPIFAGGLNSSHLREAVANQSKLSAQLEEARRKAGADARQAYAGIVNGVSQAEALQSAVESGESSVKGNQAGYKLGLRINNDVLNAQQQLFVSKRDLAKAKYDTLLQGLKLKAAAGVLSEADVQAINGLFGL